ncbi:MAG: hypothetical protein QG656_1833, partial [Candidatus Hydrogenedentes bacterium]|nr:hypothetical protein [Candidatus Hydrogenedentota bacterium]
INDFEAKDPIIQAMGANQVQIQLPGERDTKRATDLIMQTAFLTFHIVAGQDETVKTLQAISKSPKFVKKFTPFLLKPDARSPQFRVPIEHVAKIKAIIDEANEMPELVAADKLLALSQPPNPWDKEQNYEIYLMDREPLITGEGLTRAGALPDNENPGQWQITFEFGGEAATLFGEATEANINKPMAIVLDGKVCSAPTIQSKISGSGRITGRFDAQQATDLAIALNSGSLPVPIREAYTGVVGPSMGNDSIRQGMMASITGVIAVLIFMVAYYRFGGLVANVALFMNGFVLLAMFSYFKLTLTMPGIAGFVLTLGMAVDANVLIFERVREEVRNGKSLIASIEQGYQRATVTILDANATTLIAALVLLQFGTGPVQGFGVALALGIVTSVFTSLVVTKAVFDVLIARKWLKKLTMASIIPPNTKIPFVGLRNKAFTFSTVIILIGIAAFILRGPANNMGVDFAGGTSMIAKIDSATPVNIADVRKALDEADFVSPVVQEYGTEGLASNEFSIRTSEVQQKATDTDATGSTDVEGRVKTALGALGGEPTDPAKEKVTLEKVESVGPAIGAQLRQDAVTAIFYALLFIIVYLWMRYNLVFGVTAIIALIHDSFVAVGMLALFGWMGLIGGHIDMNVIAAVLTIIGYSVNDTVVVYDRIRENMKLYTSRGYTYGQIMDMAINQTLSRTILTSVVTLLTVIALFVFGGEVLHDFAFCLIVGIIIGTYSSIFVASTLAYVWQSYRKKAALGPGKATGGRKKGARENGRGAEEASL